VADVVAGDRGGRRPRPRRAVAARRRGRRGAPGRTGRGRPVAAARRLRRPAGHRRRRLDAGRPRPGGRRGRREPGVAVTDAAALHDRLATTALFGTGRRPVVLDDAPPDLAAAFAGLSGEPPEILLDAAALTAAYRRAGVTPTTATPPHAAPDYP